MESLEGACKHCSLRSSELKGSESACFSRRAGCRCSFEMES